MRNVLICAVSVMLFTAVGCKDGKMPWDKKDKDATTQMSAADDCAMCPGVQTASADGTCPKCGTKPQG